MVESVRWRVDRLNTWVIDVDRVKVSYGNHVFTVLTRLSGPPTCSGTTPSRPEGPHASWALVTLIIINLFKKFLKAEL